MAELSHRKINNFCFKIDSLNSAAIVALRKQYGLTQADFSAKFGVSVSTVQKWEQGAEISSKTGVSNGNFLAEQSLEVVS